MTRDEAKLILQSFRPDTTDAADPAFAEALEHLARDETLQAWFEQEQAFDRVMTRHLATIHPPAALKQQILDRMQARTAAFSPDATPPQAPASTNRSFWQIAGPLAAAAAVVFMIGFGISLNRDYAGPDDIPGLIAHLETNYSHPGFALEYRDADIGNLNAHLARKNIPTYPDLPAGLADVNAVGCLTLQYEGKLIGMVCFKDGDTLYHLYTADAAAFPALFPELDASDLPTYYDAGKTAYKVWTSGEILNILSREGSPEDLTDFF